MCYEWPNWQLVGVGSDVYNIVAPKRRQAILWTKDDIVHSHTYASPILNMSIRREPNKFAPVW